MASLRNILLAVVCAGLAACAAGPPRDPSPEPSPRPAAPSARDLPVGTSLDPAGGRVPGPVRTPAPPPPFSIAGMPVLGAADAPVTIVEFMDYECPYCQGYAQELFPQLKARWIDTGEVRYVLVNFPLPRHARARPAAVAAACAESQGAFWPMHERLLAKDAGPLRDEDFDGHARALELDLGAFTACRAERSDGAWLDVDVAAAQAVGVAGTPSFLIGRSTGELARGELLRGAPDLAGFAAAIERAR